MRMKFKYKNANAAYKIYNEKDFIVARGGWNPWINQS